MVALSVVTSEAHETDASTRLRLLETRLEDGWRKIELALDAGQPVQRWEELWLTLLSEYEQLHRELAA